MRKRMKVREGMKIKTVLYKSSNLLLLGLRNRKSNKVFIICEGLSMNVDDDNLVTKKDPYMTIPVEESYDGLRGDIILMYFPFECKGLEKAGDELADYVNWNMYNYDNIVLLGHSKAGVCFANMARWLNRATTMVFISSPFLGTKIADPTYVSKKLNFIEYKIYNKIYSKHDVDKDIMPESRFIKNADFSGITNHVCINVISETETIRSIEDISAWFLNNRLKYDKSDGIVEVRSQEYLRQKYPGIKTIYVDASHMNSLARILSKNRTKYIRN